MEAIKVELILKNNEESKEDTEHFITRVLPELKEKYKMIRVFYSECSIL